MAEIRCSAHLKVCIGKIPDVSVFTVLKPTWESQAVVTEAELRFV